MTRWEYEVLKLEPGGLLGDKMDDDEMKELLNRLGADGWELVSAFDTNYGEGATREVIMLLKRPVAGS
jgi:hypothetical protein